jgi:hypothetical protein
MGCSSAHHLGTSQAEEGELTQFLVPGSPSRLQDVLSISTCVQDSEDWFRVCQILILKNPNFKFLLNPDPEPESDFFKKAF